VLDLMHPVRAGRRTGKGRQGSMKPLRGGEGGTRNMAPRVGGRAQRSKLSGRRNYSPVVGSRRQSLYPRRRRPVPPCPRIPPCPL
jgi:hypothetical protein